MKRSLVAGPPHRGHLGLGMGGIVTPRLSVHSAPMLGSSLIGGGTITVMAGAAIAGGWGHIRSSFSRLWSVVVVTATVEGDAATAVRVEVWHHWRRSPFGSHRYQTNGVYVRPLGRYAAVVAEVVGMDPVLCWRGRVPLLMGASQSVNAPPGNPYPDETRITLRCIRGTMDMEAFIQAATDGFNDRCSSDRSGRFSIYRIAGSGGVAEDAAAAKAIAGRSSPRVVTRDARVLRWDPEELGPPLPDAGGGPFDNLGLCPAAEAFVAEVRRWSESEAWYRDHGIPWTRGGLLYGPPGTGKTSLVGAIGRMLDWPVYVIDLTTMSNQNLFDKWDVVRQNAPCVALFEDLDRVFRGSENIADQGHQNVTMFSGRVTMDALLNCLGGIEPADGVLKIATTNHIKHLDPALGVVGADGISTRPGRFDVAVEMGPLTEPLRRKVAARICKSYPEDVDGLVASGDGDSGAQFTERCRAVALGRYWSAAVEGAFRV